MEQTLTTAALINADAPTDRGTWVHFYNRRNLKIVVDHDPRLFNQYAVMHVNLAWYPNGGIKDGPHLAVAISSRAAQLLLF
jgi:ABC-type tungstate transport system permease subunit